MSSRPSDGFFAGIAVGLLVVSALMMFDVHIARPSPAAAAARISTVAAERFVADWSRMESGTWAVGTTYQRTTTAGATFSADGSDARRPPDRVRRSLASIDAVVGSRRYVCSATVGEAEGSCRDAGPVDADADRRARVEAVRTQVLGSGATYDVEQLEPHCYRAYARPVKELGPWGSRATFCFDARTGAPLRSEIVGAYVVDVTTTNVVRQPTEQDLLLPPIR